MTRERNLALAGRHVILANALVADASLKPAQLPAESTLSPRQIRRGKGKK